jgi:predicted transcriptional regulator
MTGKARWGALGVLVFACLVAAGVAVAQARTGSRSLQAAAVDPSCQLNSAKGNIKHVIYIQFDNTHFRRDNANVPSDLEQMPHLLNFMRGNGTLMTNDHTVLISHTATGILSSLTGVYPDRMGQPVSNSYRYFSGTGSRTGVSFAYWTAPVFDPAGTPATGADTTPTMINENGKIAPAPWVPYTRAGCDFGAVATANTILENTAIDIPTVFGANSAEAAEVASNPGQAFADFVGIGVHCAQGSALCSTANNGRPDLLPDEPGGYSGFNGLFGAKYVDPQISPNGPMTDLNGNVIQDASGHIGFPGFDGMEATVSLSWVAHMQEAGIPVTYAYISDAHDGHGTAGNIHFAYGPGEAGYVQQLKDYDLAFQKFFDRLAADGINKSNTLFAFTVDEGDHFVGDAPTPAGCDGVNVACNYNRVGEINADLRRMVRTQFGDTTPFSVHSDDAPTVYIDGNRGQTDPLTRKLERETAKLSWLNPYTNTVENNIMVAQADRTEMKTLHLVTADPRRTPTYTPFADPDWFFFATGGATCATPAACAFIPARTNQSFAWNHGDIQDEIASTWVGYVGPGVKNDGDFTGWTDHTDVRPTMLSLLGLNDDYLRDGRPVTQVLDSGSVPATLQSSDAIALGDMLKRLDAPFGEFGMNTLKASSIALASDTNHDNRYTTIEKSIASLTDQRDQVVDAIKAQLAGAETGTAIDHTTASDLLDRAQGLLGHAAGLGH